MPRITLLFYREGSEVPALDWLLSVRNEEAQDKCFAAMLRLEELGHEARRPLVDTIGQGLYELRIRVGKQNYRFLYFFYGRTAVVLTSGFTKEDEIPEGEIELALRRKQAFERDPETHCAQRED